MSTVYFDWSMRRGVAAVFDKENEVRSYPSIYRLLDDLTGPSTLISETTFESFNTSRRAEVIQAVADAGHVWLVHPTRLTAKVRRAAGAEKTTDEDDALWIRQVAKKHTSALRPAQNLLEEGDPRRVRLEATQKQLVEIRRAYRVQPSERARLGYTVKKLQEVVAKEIESKLPNPKTLEPSLKASLVTGIHYADSLLVTVYVAAQQSSSRKEFEAIMGLYAGGYPSMMRSNALWHRYRAASKAGATLSEFRRAVRWLYHQTKGLDAVSLDW